MSDFILWLYKSFSLHQGKILKIPAFYHWNVQVNRAPALPLLHREGPVSNQWKDTSKIRSSSISLKTVPLIWFGFRATQLNTGILNFVLIGFLIFTATEVRENKIKIPPRPQDPWEQSDNSPCRWHFNTGGSWQKMPKWLKISHIAFTRAIWHHYLVDW